MSIIKRKRKYNQNRKFYVSSKEVKILKFFKIVFSRLFLAPFYFNTLENSIKDRYRILNISLSNFTPKLNIGYYKSGCIIPKLPLLLCKSTISNLEEICNIPEQCLAYLTETFIHRVDDKGKYSFYINELDLLQTLKDEKKLDYTIANNWCFNINKITSNILNTYLEFMCNIYFKDSVKRLYNKYNRYSITNVPFEDNSENIIAAIVFLTAHVLQNYPDVDKNLMKESANFLEVHIGNITSELINDLYYLGSCIVNFRGPNFNIFKGENNEQ